MAKLATGKFAFGQCQRCGAKVPYTSLVSDGQHPNLRVCVTCRDIKNPQERPFTAEDGIALAHPAPDLDKANAAVGDSTPLIDVLPPLDGGTFSPSLPYAEPGYIENQNDYVP